MKNFCRVIFMSTALACLLGCGPKLPHGMPKLYPTTILVQYDDGKPLAGATVVFYAVDPTRTGKTWVHAGNTDAQGKAALMTQGKYHGIPAAAYNVTVTKFIHEGKEPTEPGPQATAKELANYRKALKSSDAMKRYLVVDVDYNDPQKTPLRNVETKAEANNLELKVGKEVKILSQAIPLI